MRPAVGAVRDRALHFRHAPRRLCRSSRFAFSIRSEAALPLVARARSSGGRSFAVHRQSASQCFVAGDALAGARASPLLALLASCRARRKPRPPWIRFARFSRLRPASSLLSSSPMPQPASRHSIKPFSIQPIIANIRHSAVSTSQYRFAIWGRRCGECPFAFFAAEDLTI